MFQWGKVGEDGEAMIDGFTRNDNGSWYEIINGEEFLIDGTLLADKLEIKFQFDLVIDEIKNILLDDAIRGAKFLRLIVNRIFK